MKIHKIIIFVVVIIASLCLYVVYSPKTLKIPLDELQKIEIVEVPLKSDSSSIAVITEESELNEFINNLNSMQVRKTKDFFQESPNKSIKICYKNGASYLIEYNYFSQSNTLFRLTKIESGKAKGESNFFYVTQGDGLR